MDPQVARPLDAFMHSFIWSSGMCIDWGDLRRRMERLRAELERLRAELERQPDDALGNDPTTSNETGIYLSQ